MKKLFLWTFVVTLLCTWAVAGADQTPTTPTTSSMAPAGDLDAIKAEKDKAAQEILSGKALLSDVAPARLAVPKLEKEKAEAEIQQAGPALIQLRVPDPDVILLVNDKTGIASPAGTTPGGDVALVEVCPPNSMYSAPPHGPSDAWSAGTSDVAFVEDYLRYDNFTGATGDICDIHWWGMSLHYDLGWYVCEEDPYAFEIIFYRDDGAGKPDTLNPVYTYSPAVPARTNTGDLYAGFPLWRYDMILDPCVQGLASGWVSIRGIIIDPDYDCQFLWMSSPIGDGHSWFRNSGNLEDYLFNLSMCITGEYVETYGACCDDETGICTDDIEQLQCPQPLRFAANTLCAALDPPCGEIPGACCFEDGSCIVMTASDCADAQGVYYGDGTVCDPNPCPQPSIYPCMDAEIIHWDNGDTDGSNGLSMLSGAGQYRSILDDFIVEEEILLTDFHQTLLWNVLQPPQAEGYDLILWTDVAGAPGVPIMTLNATLISEVLTGRVWFGRNEFVVTVYIEPTVIPAGTYWLEMHILETGGENAFCMAQSPPNILLNPVWVIYEDMTGPNPVPGFDVFAADYGVNFCLTGDPIPEEGACCFEDGSCIVMMPDDCIGAGGVFWGIGTVCDPNPCPQPCYPDYSVVAPVENATGTTCGALDDCDLRASEDIIYEIEIPEDGEWTFSLCNSDFDTYMFVGTTCCGQEVGYNDDFCGVQSQLTAIIPAGTYYVDIEAYGTTTCGNYVLNVWMTEPCVVECPPGGTIEPEPCGEDTNGGCGADPPTMEFGTVSCEETMCGTAWADNGTRDTDWFELDLAEETMVFVTGEAEFPYQLGIITPGDPDPCLDLVVNAIDQAAECVVLTISATVGPGIVWIWAGDADFYDNPCGNDDDDYYFTVSCGGCEDYMTVEIFTDAYPEETTWEMYERDSGTLVASAGPLANPDYLYTWQVCGDPGLCYDWYIFDLYGDGICCLYGDGYYNIYDFTGALVCTGGEFGAMDACEGIGQCVPPIGACCVGTDCIGDMEEEPCVVDNQGTWYVGETCDTFICPIDCNNAVYHNGDGIGGAFASQCDTEYPMQAEVCDDFVLPGEEAIQVTSIVGWMGFWNRTPPADPWELESVIFDIYNDNGQGTAPAGNPIDMDPDCAREGDIVWTHEYAQGQFGYMEEPGSPYWRIWVTVENGPILEPGVTYWIGWAGRHFFSTAGQGGPQPTDQQTGSFALLYFPLLGYTEWTNVWSQDIGFCINGIPSGGPDCDYVPGDCNHNGVALELADVIAMIGMYRGSVPPAYTCDCPPHGATFAPEADPNGNCVALELADVVAEIAAYRGTGTAYGCVDCPGDGPPPPLLGKEGTSVVPSLKSKVKTTQQGSAD